MLLIHPLLLLLLLRRRLLLLLLLLATPTTPPTPTSTPTATAAASAIASQARRKSDSRRSRRKEFSGPPAAKNDRGGTLIAHEALRCIVRLRHFAQGHIRPLVCHRLDCLDQGAAWASASTAFSGYFVLKSAACAASTSHDPLA